jgi:hypothetical protein
MFLTKSRKYNKIVTMHRILHNKIYKKSTKKAFGKFRTLFYYTEELIYNHFTYGKS